MNEKAKAAYDAALAKAIITNGTLCGTRSWTYGYIANDYETLYECRTKGCEITYGKIDEGSWADFDSFAADDPERRKRIADGFQRRNVGSREPAKICGSRLRPGSPARLRGRNRRPASAPQA